MLSLIAFIISHSLTPIYLQTGIYYLRTRPAVNAKQITVSKTDEKSDADATATTQTESIPELNDSECLSCSA